MTEGTEPHRADQSKPSWSALQRDQGQIEVEPSTAGSTCWTGFPGRAPTWEETASHTLFPLKRVSLINWSCFPFARSLMAN